MTKPELLISVDIETDGPIPGIHSIASIGAALVDDLDCNFYIELKPISDQFDPQAVVIMAEGGLDRDCLLREGVGAEEAMIQLQTWIKQVSGRKYRPVFAGFNAPFDWMFVHWYFIRFLGVKPFGISALDIKSYMMGVLRLERWSDTVASKIPERFRSDLPHTHNALDDARQQGDVLAKLMRFAAELEENA